MMKRKVTVKNPSGLHMRPAGIFVKAATPFKSTVEFEVRGTTYNAKSMINVLSAAVKSGDVIELKIAGADEKACMDTLVSAVESGLGE